MKNTQNHSDMLEIIFAGKNKAYGAYQIRRSYPDYLFRAFLGAVTLIFILSALPKILSNIAVTKTESVTEENRIFTTVKTPEKQPQPKLKIAAALPPVAKQTFRLVPPKVLPNELVTDQQKTATVEEAEKSLGTPGKTSSAGIGEEEVPQFPGTGGLYEPPVARTEAVDTVVDIIRVEKMPSFPGGDGELIRFISENLEYPAIARETNITGTVALSFVVGKDGGISDVKILKEIGGGCGKEAVRVLKMMPRWTPGESNGHPVKVRFTLPVKFRLQ